MTKGQLLTVGFQNPFAWVHDHCEHSPNYSSIVQQTLEKHPCTPASPWTLRLDQDGMDSVDGLDNNKSRHSGVFFSSFLEVGMETLCREEAWGTVTIVRTRRAASTVTTLVSTVTPRRCLCVIWLTANAPPPVARPVNVKWMKPAPVVPVALLVSSNTASQTRTILVTTSQPLSLSSRYVRTVRQSATSAVLHPTHSVSVMVLKTSSYAS